MDKHIVLIDDDEEEKEIFEAALKKTKLSCSFTYICNPLDAPALLQKLKPGLIFIDFKMPVINGIECLIEIKQKKNLRSIPVIMYSSKTDAILSLALQAGAVKCITKTTSVKLLAEILQDVISVY